MAAIAATRLRKGHLIKHNSELCRLLEVQHVTPGNLRGFVRAKMRNVRTGSLIDHRFRSEDVVDKAVLDEREMQYLYNDGADYYFMDTSSYEQIHLSAEALGDAMQYLLPEATITVEFFEGAPVGLELPQTVDLKVTETVPGIKGATANAQVKPATLETGLVVNVPAFVNTGDVVRISTDSGEYCRAPDAAAGEPGPMDIVRHKPGAGWIEVITGSMFSGKSEELIRRLRRAQIARQKVQIFKPRIDNRYGDDHITSHSEMRIPSENVSTSRELLDRVRDDTDVVGIDEGQFFDVELPAVCNTLADQGRRVLVAGLDQDYLGKPFEPMPQLLAIAEYITKTLAICVVCGSPANHTQRLVASSERVLVGATGTYEARCRACFDPRLAGPDADGRGPTGESARAGG